MVTVVCRVWLHALLLLASFADPAAAQTQPSRFGIADNSFLVEEAFNQEPRIFQNIFAVRRTRGGIWDGTFTQEWPLASQTHQLSFAVPFLVGGGASAFGEIALNYRWQASLDEGRWPAISPRITLLLPTSEERRPLGFSGTGLQVNLPVSKELGWVIVHGNLGATWFNETTVPFAAGSLIWGLRPMFHPMLEVTTEWTHVDAKSSSSGRDTTVTVLPGFRTGWNFGDQQVVLGFGIPMTRGAEHDNGALVYFSYELPFRKQ
jgi:hypothetical protein